MRSNSSALAGPGHVLDQFSIEFLSPQQSVRVSLLHGIEEASGQVRGIVESTSSRDCDFAPRTFRQQPPHQGNAARSSRGNDSGIMTEPQAHQQVIPACHGPATGIAPLADLVAPGMAVLRAAQCFRLTRRIERSLRAIGPDEPAQRGLEAWPTPWRAHGQEAAFPFDHDRARFTEAGSDEGNTRIGILLGYGVDPFRAGSRLAEAAPCHDEPHAPFPGRRDLRGAPPNGPGPAQLAPFRGIKCGNEALEVFLVGFSQPVQGMGFSHDAPTPVHAVAPASPGGTRARSPDPHSRAALAHAPRFRGASRAGAGR